MGRGEYQWKMLGGDWQLSAEAAFNTLDNVARLYTLDPASDDFVEIPYPEGTGGVKEDRYEALLSFGRKLTDKLSFQLVAGAEHSTLARSEEHTSELQSLMRISYAVFCLKKKIT